MHPEFIVSVDIGTTKVAILIGEFSEQGTMRIIGADCRPSYGMRKGMVVDMEAAAGSVSRAVARAEKMAGVEIRGVCAGISGPHIRSFNSRGVVSLPEGRKEVIPEDISRVTDGAQNITLPSDMEVLHTVRQDFMVDRNKGIRDPVGMAASRLGVEVHMVTTQSSHVENFMKVFRKNGLEVMSLVFQPLASAESVLSDGEKEAGCLVIDVGGGITDYALYQGGSVRVSGVIGAGGENISKDLAIGLRVPDQVAEEIKLKYGLALESLAGEDEVVVVPGEQENGGREIRRQIIAAIIEPRCEEIFSMIKEAVSSDPYYGMMGGGVVITGGGSKIMGMKGVAGQIFGLPVRRGRPGGLSGLAEIVSDESWSSSVGLLFYESDRILREEKRRSSGRFGWMLENVRKIASLF